MVKLLDEAEIEVDPSLPTDADPLEELEEGGENEGTAEDESTGSGYESMKSEESEEKKGKGKPNVKEEQVVVKGKGKKRKLLPATYEPDKRAMSWLKVKKDYMEYVNLFLRQLAHNEEADKIGRNRDLGDSLDLVVIGAWHGSGRKAGWWSPFLLGTALSSYSLVLRSSPRRPYSLLRRGDWSLHRSNEMSIWLHRRFLQDDEGEVLSRCREPFDESRMLA